MLAFKWVVVVVKIGDVVWKKFIESTNVLRFRIYFVVSAGKTFFERKKNWKQYCVSRNFFRCIFYLAAVRRDVYAQLSFWGGAGGGRLLSFRENTRKARRWRGSVRGRGNPDDYWSAGGAAVRERRVYANAFTVISNNILQYIVAEKRFSASWARMFLTGFIARPTNERWNEISTYIEKRFRKQIVKLLEKLLFTSRMITRPIRRRLESSNLSCNRKQYGYL